MGELSLLLGLPVAGVVVIAFTPAHRVGLIRWLAVAVACANLGLALAVAARFVPDHVGLQFLELVRWNPRLGSYYAVGVDGISLPMVLLATLLFPVALLVSGGVRDRGKGYYIPFLLLEAATLGVFMAQDWSLFYVFWELTLIPLFFLINGYGGKLRNRAALNFVLYTMGGSVFMLIGMLLAFDASALHTFLMSEMAAGMRDAPRELQILIFLGFLIGLGVKMPLFPLHGWLPLAHVEAPSPVSIILSGVLLKMGSYGLIRAANLLPEAIVALQGVVAALALINLIYGGVLAWRQSDLKGMIAYSSISHMGVVVLGIAALNQSGLDGAITQMVAHGLTAGALFLVIGLLYERTHTRELTHYSSLTRVAPRFALVIAGLLIAAVGVPGSVGFIAELQVIVASLARWGWWAVWLSVGMLVSAATAVRTIGVLCTGPERVASPPVRDLGRLEFATAGVLMLAIVVLGSYPAPLLELIAPVTLGWEGRFVN